MIKLIDLLELNVNNSRITKEKIFEYYKDNVINNNDFFNYIGSASWYDRIELEDKYSEKYKLGNFWNWLRGSIHTKIILNNNELNELYTDIKYLVETYSLND